jgi:hypothetical protein
MSVQELRVEHRVTPGDEVGAVVAGAICLTAVALVMNFIDIRDRPSVADHVEYSLARLSMALAHNRLSAGSVGTEPHRITRMQIHRADKL